MRRIVDLRLRSNLLEKHESDLQKRHEEIVANVDTRNFVAEWAPGLAVDATDAVQKLEKHIHHERELRYLHGIADRTHDVPAIPAIRDDIHR